MKKQKQKKVFKKGIDAIVKIITCLLFFIVLGVEGKSFILTIIIKLGGSILLFYFMLLLDKYGRI